MAQLLSWLALSGARDSAGAPVSSGFAWFYQPGGGTTTQTVYSDVDGTIVASQPVALDAGGRAVVYVTDPVRIVVQNAYYSPVADCDQADVSRAEAVQVDNTGWSDDYLDSILSKLYASTGGVDGQYMESGGATARTLRAKFAEIWISVKDFGAKGDGLTVDTTSVQAAINRAGFLGGGVVYFPPGTYLIDQGLTSAVSGVRLLGAGSAASIIKYTGSTASALTFASCSAVGASGLGITTVTTSSGSGIVLSAAVGAQFSDVNVTGFVVALMSTSSSSIACNACSLVTVNVAGNRAIKATDTFGITITGGTLHGQEYALELLGGTSNLWMGGVNITRATTGVVRLDAAMTGTGFALSGCTGVTTNWFSVGPAAEPANVSMTGCSYKADATTAATGTAVTPTFANSGRQYEITATTGAGTVTVNAPVPTPARGYRFFTVHINAAGGAVTWAMNAIYVLDAATAIPTTDLHTVIVEWVYDAPTSKIREVGRTNTLS